VLFILYINDIDVGVNSFISKFADDTKIAGQAANEENCQQIQKDLDKLSEWSEKCQMPFNVSKCTAMHMGRKNVETEYNMSGWKLVKSSNGKDLGVTISNDLKPSKQCLEAVKQANRMLGLISRSFEFKSQKVILTLYNALVRPHLEYAVQFWSPQLAKDKDLLERVQRRATKLISNLRNKSYEVRLIECNLFSLEKRRHRGDMIQVFKILNKIDNVNEENYFQRNNDLRTRNNGFKLIGKPFRTNAAKHYFTSRVIEDWNKLPAYVVNSTSVEMFKNRLDKYYEANNIF
jgi:hypothetical protein